MKRKAEEAEMEWAVYRSFLDDNGRKMGSFVNMLPSREEAEAFAEGLEGDHEIVGLWTREIAEEDGPLWDTILFEEGGSVTPVGGR